MPSNPDTPSVDDVPQTRSTDGTLLLHQEELNVSRRVIQGDTVRVTATTRLQMQAVEQELRHQRVAIERVAIGREVTAMPPVREEDGVLIMPVVEEVLVVQRKLVLKEEVRMRRIAVTEQHRETVSLRTEDAVVTRHPAQQAV